MAAFIPAVIVALYFVQKYYLRTSRQMRFLDLEYKSPLYTHFTETLAGVSTIRAFGWSTAFMNENARKLNTSQKPFYLMTCIQRWLEVVLDLFIAGLALVLVSIALRVSGASSQGAIGLALVNLLDFSQTLTLVIDQWTQLETSLGAIARLKWFVNNTPNENKESEKENPPADWPAQGAIEFDNVSASYSDGTKTVLQDVSLKIEPGQKVGVCGRSGSGKSSLVLSLLRLLELQSGSITIDGVDIATLPRQHIRSHLNTTPQDPISITGTVRENLDPESSIDSEHLLIAALTKTQIWPLISERGGLDAILADLGFSAGQQQLFSLARALLSRNKIVLLDEPTSSVDYETDREIRRIVTQEMQGRTVIEVAHRLEVVKDFDVVVVMGEGRVLEVGRPEVLLARESELRSLWRSQGL